MEQSILEIAGELMEIFLAATSSEEDILLFLCGGASPADSSFRRQLGNQLVQRRSKYRYSVYYPEDMFLELILGHGKYDLLSLENLLADSVSAVVVPLQSPGTFTELGAFANHVALRNKLIVLMDPKFQTSQSFINAGPIRFLRAKTSSRVIHEVLSFANLDVLVNHITEAARSISAQRPVIASLTNPLTSREFYHALVFVFDPLPRACLEEIISALSPSESQALTVAEMVINGLINERKIASTASSLTIPPETVNSILQYPSTKKRKDNLVSTLSDLRLQALNAVMRGKESARWLGAA
jgi:hypothetical protein